MFQGVFEGALEGILKTLPTKTASGGHSATNFTCKGGPEQCIMYYILHFGPFPYTQNIHENCMLARMFAHEIILVDISFVQNNGKHGQHKLESNHEKCGCANEHRDHSCQVELQTASVSLIEGTS